MSDTPQPNGIADRMGKVEQAVASMQASLQSFFVSYREDRESIHSELRDLARTANRPFNFGALIAVVALTVTIVIAYGQSITAPLIARVDATEVRLKAAELKADSSDRWHLEGAKANSYSLGRTEARLDAIEGIVSRHSDFSDDVLREVARTLVARTLKEPSP